MKTLRSILAAAALAPLAIVTGCDSAPKREVATADVKRDTERARQLNEQAAKKIEDGRLDEAEELLRQAIAADPTYPPARNNMGLVHFEKGRLYPAAAEFEVVIRLLPQAAAPRNNLGLVFERAGKADDAIKWFEQAHRMEDANPEYLGNLLRARIKRGEKTAEVKAQLERLVFIETRPDWRSWAEEQLARWPRATTAME